MARREAGPVHQVANAALQRAADQRLLVLRRPLAAQPAHHGVLDLKPERLGVYEQPVHVKQHSLKLTVGLCRRHQVLKYFASR